MEYSFFLWMYGLSYSHLEIKWLIVCDIISTFPLKFNLMSYPDRNEVKRIEYEKVIATYNPEKPTYIDTLGLIALFQKNMDRLLEAQK